MKGRIINLHSLIIVLFISHNLANSAPVPGIQNEATKQETANTNQTGSGNQKAQDYNSSRSNKTSRAQDHNSVRSNKSASAQDYNSSRSNKTSRAQDHNSVRSNKTASAIADFSGDQGGENALRATNHNSTRSNRTNTQVRGLVISATPSYSSSIGKNLSSAETGFPGNGMSGNFSADYFFGKFGVGFSNGLIYNSINKNAINERLGSLGYEPSATEITTSPGQKFFMLAGPTFRTGNKIQFSFEGKGGMFINNPGIAKATSTSGTGDVINVSGSSKVFKPGFLTGVNVSYNFPGQMSLGFSAGYSGNGNTVSQYDAKTRVTTEKSFFSQQFHTGITLSVRLHNKKIIHRDLAARESAPDKPTESNEDESKEEPRRDTLLFYASKIEFRQNLDESKRGNEIFTATGVKAEENMVFTGDLDGDAIPDIVALSSSPLVESYKKSRGKMGNLQSNPLFKEKSQTPANPVYNNGGKDVNNPLYEGSINNSGNPIYNSAGSGGSNPLYGGQTRNSNPVYQSNSNSGTNPLAGEKSAILTTGGISEILFPSTLEVNVTTPGNLKSSVWLDCRPSGETPQETTINTTRTNIRKVHKINSAGGMFTAEVIVESGGAEYDAVITGRVMSIKDGKRGILSLIR